MTLIDGATIDKKFADLNIIQSVYKTVGDHGIRVDMLIPKILPAGKRPVVARFHGGGLVLGDSLFPDWFHPWNIELLIKYGAVMASPNYRFLPESTGVDILADVDDFWTWLQSREANDLLSEHNIEMDLDRVITAGESAGGQLALYLALSQPEQIRAATASYPMVNQDPPTLWPSVPDPLFPAVSESIAIERLKNKRANEVASSAPPPERGEFGAVMLGSRKLLKYYTRDADQSPQHRDFLFLTDRVGHPDQRLPRGGISIIHGIDDDVVPPEASVRFVNKARAVFRGRGDDKILVTLQPGGHGFDGTAKLEDPWMVDALRFVIPAWLQ